MDGRMFDFKDIKCNICKNLLSVPPIIYTDSTGTICGRCNHFAYEKNSNPVINRQVIFEKLASEMDFPCMYKDQGCKEVIDWGEVKNHEESCVYRVEIKQEPSQIVNVPVKKQTHSGRNGYNDCDWSGSLEEFPAHAKESHQDKFVHPPFITLNGVNKTRFVFYEFLDNFVVFLIFYDEVADAYFCRVFTEFNCKPLKYHLKILDSKRIELIRLSETYSMALPFKITKIRKVAQKVELSKINSTEKPEYFLIEFESRKAPNIPIIEVFNRFSIPRCIECDMYLTPPLFSCHKGHCYCKYCMKLKPECNKAKVRNRILESLLLSAHYTCDKIECSFVGSSSNYDLHQELCIFKPKECPISDCTWTRFELIHHVRNSHEIYNLNEYISLSQDVKEFLFVFDEHVFLLERKFDENVKKWFYAKFLLICIGAVEVEYKYEIEIYCPDCPFARIAFENFAQPEYLNRLSDFESNEVEMTKINKLFPYNSEIVFKLNISNIDIKSAI